MIPDAPAALESGMYGRRMYSVANIRAFAVELATTGLRHGWVANVAEFRRAAMSAVYLIDALTTARRTDADVVFDLLDAFRSIGDAEDRAGWKSHPDLRRRAAHCSRAQAWRALANEVWYEVGGAGSPQELRTLLDIRNETRQGITDHL